MIRRKTRVKIPDENHLLSVGVYDKLLGYKNPDLISLYTFYCRTAIKQKTNQIWAVDQFCLKGTGLGRVRFRTAKKQLCDIGLIQQFKGTQKETGQFSKAYIKVNYTWIDTNSRTTGSSRALINKDLLVEKSKDLPMNRTYGSRTYGNRTTNALKNIKQINTEKNIYRLFENSFSKSHIVSEEFNLAIERYIKYRQEKNLSIDLPLMKDYAKRLAKISTSDEAIASIDNAIKNGWSGFYKPTKSKNELKEDSYHEAYLDNSANRAKDEEEDDEENEIANDDNEEFERLYMCENGHSFGDDFYKFPDCKKCYKKKRCNDYSK
ncbi:MAG: hypothetical protein ABR974_00415 [Bacteroidales bacterium]|jgi:hypothetical protein